jgi:signal transduction histidine kinase
MERSLHRAEKAEAALLRQKALLETTVQQRTQQLQTVQLEKIRQMYRFAELGQLSTALLHDLSNHLTTLTLDIEGLEGQKRSRALSRAKRSIRYIDDMVVRVRDQLHGKNNARPFNIPEEINEVVKMLRHKAQAYDVLLKWQMPADKKSIKTRGEPIRFRQLMANLISNAIDAYYEPRSLEEQRDVQIEVHAGSHDIIIRVSDWGRGISKGSKLFEPFYSTKQTGMGMGLYIAKQVAEEHFLGEIMVDETKGHTSFVVTLPKVTS